MSHRGKGEWGETNRGIRSTLNVDWKTNPRPKPGRQKDKESTRNHCTRLQAPLRLYDSSGRVTINKRPNGACFSAGKRIPKIEFGWWKRSAVEIAV